jgi:hypothetical protein
MYLSALTDEKARPGYFTSLILLVVMIIFVVAAKAAGTDP